MESELAAYGVSVVAISKDDQEQASQQQRRDGIRFPLLTDPNLEVIKLYGVEHHKAVEFSTFGFTVAGVPLALLPSWKTMAIPTTLLIDEAGIIRWIDQSDDYRLRSDEGRILAALERIFPKSAVLVPNPAIEA